METDGDKSIVLPALLVQSDSDMIEHAKYREELMQQFNQNGQFSDSSMKMHVFNHWTEKIYKDGVFDRAEYPARYSSQNCQVSESNAQELLEALEVTDYLTEEELV